MSILFVNMTAQDQATVFKALTVLKTVGPYKGSRDSLAAIDALRTHFMKSNEVPTLDTELYWVTTALEVAIGKTNSIDEALKYQMILDMFMPLYKAALAAVGKTKNPWQG